MFICFIYENKERTRKDVDNIIERTYNEINQRDLWFVGFRGGGFSVSQGSLTPNRYYTEKKRTIYVNFENAPFEGAFFLGE